MRCIGVETNMWADRHSAVQNSWSINGDIHWTYLFFHTKGIVDFLNLYCICSKSLVSRFIGGGLQWGLRSSTSVCGWTTDAATYMAFHFKFDSSLQQYIANFHSCTVHLDTIKVFYLPTDATKNCFKKNIKIYIKIAPTCFGSITIIREHILWAC
jgi:hypothetical protein